MPGFILCAIIYVLYIVVVEKSINILLFLKTLIYRLHPELYNNFVINLQDVIIKQIKVFNTVHV